MSVENDISKSHCTTKSSSLPLSRLSSNSVSLTVDLILLIGKFHHWNLFVEFSSHCDHVHLQNALQYITFSTGKIFGKSMVDQKDQCYTVTTLLDF